MFGNLPKRATRDNADQFISARVNFKTGGALSGYESGSDPINHTGRLPEEYRESFRDSEYRVYSYATPIAWWSVDRGWERPDVSYSVTTSRHQGKCPRTTDQHTDQHVTCGTCGRTWCEKCDPAPSALCHYCHGRGYSTAPVR